MYRGTHKQQADQMNRRKFVSTLAVGALTGCQTSFNESTVRLGTVEITNRLSRRQTVTVTVRIGDETVYDERHNLPAQNDDFVSRRIDDALPSEASNYTFDVGTDTGAELTVSYTEPHENGCYNLIFAVTRQETVDVLEGMMGDCPD